MRIQPALTRCSIAILIIGGVFCLQFSATDKGVLSVLAQDLSNAATKKTNTSDTITGIVLDSSGHPVPGITIDAMPPGVNEDSFRFRQEAKTDASGRFTLEGLPDKAFVLSTQAYSFSTSSETHVPGDYVVLRIEKGGVITGRVTDVNGNPVVHVRVQLEKVKRSDGKPLGRFEQMYTYGLQRSTDDRGVYRIWDVPPGSYLVAAGGKNKDYTSMVTQYDEDAPTYYPSSALRSATQVAVSTGQEIAGIDIQYRGDSGHSITGRIKSGMVSSKNSNVETTIDLFTSAGRYLGNTDPSDDESNSFGFQNLSDGEYKVIANRTTNDDLTAISTPKTVTIKGGDVGGITLNILPLAVISAHVTLDVNPATDCKTSQRRNLEQVLLSFKSENPDDVILSIASGSLGQSFSPAAKGDVSVKRLAGNYHLAVWLPTDDWYVASMTTPASPKPADVAVVGLSLKSGQKSNLTIALKNGAASLTGTVSSKDGNGMIPPARVYLMPAESSRVDEALRFAESELSTDGTFKFKNLAPGSYKVIAEVIDGRPMKSNSRPDAEKSPIETHEGRAWLIQEAKDASVIELHPCERKTGYNLKY